MQLYIEAVSKSGLGVMSGNNWYNKAKGASFNSFDGLKKGDGIEAEVSDDKWIKSYTLLSAGKASPTPSTNKGPASATEALATRYKNTDESIARAVAVKSVFESKFIADNLKDMDYSQAYSAAKELVLDVETYLLTGAFKSEAK